MTTYYVGSGGNDTNDGLSWANRFLTLNGAEDEPVAAGDTVYVGPGVYREALTCDVAGTSGNPITYIGDVTGDNTDGVGGVVRITGSDNDTTATRGNCIICTSGAGRDFRTFRGFTMDMCTSYLFNATNGQDDIIIEDCVFHAVDVNTQTVFIGGTGTNLIIRRCVFYGGREACIYLYHGSDHATANYLIENCIFFGPGRYNTACITANLIGDTLIKNCTLIGGYLGVEVTGALSDTVTVNNCTIIGQNTGLTAANSGDLTEDYNNIYAVGTARTNVTTGTNSNTYPALFEPPIQLDGIEFGAPFTGKLSEWSQIARIAGTTEAADDIYGITRPTTSAKKSWGAVQYQPSERETTTTQGGSTASIKLADAGSQQLFVEHGGSSITISVYCYRETNYAGTNPRMVIKQPGQSDRTTTDVGSASTWNQLSDTFTPAANPPYVVVELQSLNTATSGSYATFFDTVAAA